MNRYEFALTALRMFAVYLVIQLLGAIGMVYVSTIGYAMEGVGSMFMALLMFIISLAIPLLTAAWLWFDTDRIVDRIFSYERTSAYIETEEEDGVDGEEPPGEAEIMEAPDERHRINAADIQVVALTVLGVFILASTLPEFISFVVKGLGNTVTGSGGREGLRSTFFEAFMGGPGTMSFTTTLATIIQVIIGFILTFRSADISQRLRRGSAGTGATGPLP